MALWKPHEILWKPIQDSYIHNLELQIWPMENSADEEIIPLPSLRWPVQGIFFNTTQKVQVGLTDFVSWLSLFSCFTLPISHLGFLRYFQINYLHILGSAFWRPQAKTVDLLPCLRFLGYSCLLTCVLQRSLMFRFPVHHVIWS